MWFSTKFFACLCLVQLAASFDRSAVENEVRYSLGYNRGDVQANFRAKIFMILKD